MHNKIDNKTYNDTFVPYVHCLLVFNQITITDHDTNMPITKDMFLDFNSAAQLRFLKTTTD